MKKLIIGLLIFLGIFIILSVVITYSSIQNSKKSSVNDIHGSEEVNIENETNTDIYSGCNEGIDLYGTYDENDLLVKELSKNYNGIEVKIPKIEGLKDNNTQDKINQDIYSRVDEVLNQYPIIKNASYYTYGNFANIISISFIIYYDNLGIRRICLNYNLKDGERLELEDIFINDADILEVVKKATLDMMLYNSNHNYTYENDISSIDENKFYKYIKGYMNSEDKQFILSPSEVLFFYDDVMVSVEMTNIADKISIYSKYLTDESLYIRNDIGNKNIFTCIKPGVYEGNPYLEENFWYDVAGEIDFYTYEISKEKYNKFYEFKSNIYNELDEKVVEYRNKANANRDKFYVLISYPYVSICEVNDNENIYEKSNMISVSKKYEIIEMPMDIYEKEYKYKLIDAYRTEYFGVNRDGQWQEWWETSENVDVVKESCRKLYNYITAEELVKLEDVFDENSGYIEFIKLQTKERLIKEYNYTEEEIENLLKDVNYQLDGDSVNVTGPMLGEFQNKIYISDFDISMLKHVDK